MIDTIAKHDTIKHYSVQYFYYNSMNINILGVSAFYHDSAAALVRDGEIIAAAQEERFTRKKHDHSFPRNAVSFCLGQGGLGIDNVDAVVFYDKPLLKFERLLESYCTYAPSGLRSFVAGIPLWIKEKLFLKELIKKELSGINGFNQSTLNLLFSNHHLSHAASAFFPSPFEESAVLTIDGVGEWATGAIGFGKGNTVKLLKELRFPHSVGLLYSAFTYYLGFKVNSGEYKLMGLAPYGDPASERVREYEEIIRNKIVDIKDDGSIWLNQRYFNYITGLRMIRDKDWQGLFGFPRRNPEDEIKQYHCDLALAIQRITEDIVLRMAKTAKRLTGARYLCLAGGVALNCVANARLLKEGIFDDIWIQPASGDAGGALGAAYAIYYMYYGKPRESDGRTDKMKGTYLGPEFSDSDIKSAVMKYNAPYKYFEDAEELFGIAADLLANGKVIGWFQGRMEFGPRALGNRSILGDARNKGMQKRLNLKIKYRESFRPFAPAVLYEDTGVYFDNGKSSPYMLLIAELLKDRRNPLPEDYYKRPIREKLYFVRSDLPAITHLDFSARLQTVHNDTNSRFWDLINTYKDKTGCSVVVNTSFNVRGEPIVCTPEDAYRCFMRTDMDCLVMGDLLFDKKDQPIWNEGKDWREDYVLD